MTLVQCGAVASVDAARIRPTELDVHLRNDLTRIVLGAETDEVPGRFSPQGLHRVVHRRILLRLTRGHKQRQTGAEGEGLVDVHSGEGIADSNDTLCDAFAILARRHCVQCRVDVAFLCIGRAHAHQDRKGKSKPREHVIFLP